jgi:subtilisin family serine protease
MVGKTVGVAFEAILHPCKSLNDQGSGTDESVAECITWATDHAEQNGWIQQSVGNMSLGGGKSPALDAVLCDSIKRGMFWAVAAGNETSAACGGSPADTDEAFTVAAVDRLDAFASFSNFGACVDGCAPGVNVSSIGGDLSGTSMASPHVAGAAAVLRGLFPELTPAQIAARIVSMGTRDVLTGVPGETPNLMLFVGKGQ